VAPREPSTFSLRWQFAPTVSTRDGSIHWHWLAYTQAGRLFARSEKEFETLTECMEDAKQNGYDR
jgi:hypothetical protein